VRRWLGEAVELIVGTFPLRSNLPEIHGTGVVIDFPLLPSSSKPTGTAWWAARTASLLGKGFLAAYQSSAAAVGRLAEDLLCQVVLERLLAACWPEGRVVAVQDALRSGELVARLSDERCDGLVLVDRGGLILGESKRTIGAWS
jgi:hypothetical protein